MCWLAQSSSARTKRATGSEQIAHGGNAALGKAVGAESSKRPDAPKLAQVLPAGVHRKVRPQGRPRNPSIFLLDASPQRALRLLNRTSAFGDYAYLSLHTRFVRAGDTRARPFDLRCP
jgi:hypothetical protein